MSFNFDDSADFLLDDSIVKKPKRLTNDASKKRQRKSKKQIAMLEEYYLKSENWSNEFVLEIAEQTGLAAKQVAKWLWDRNLKKKEEKGKQHKRIKTKEDDEDEPSDAPVEIKQEIKQEVKMETLEDKRDLADFKDKESIGTISMIDGLIASRPKEEPDIKPKTLDKLENESNFSSKNSAKSLSLRERCSKANKIRGLKIKAPSIDELIKKPNPIGQDATNNFISNLSVYSKDLVSLPNNTPKSNSVVNSATPSIFQQSLIRDDKKVLVVLYEMLLSYIFRFLTFRSYSQEVRRLKLISELQIKICLHLKI